MKLYNILRKPIITEKSMKLVEDSVYTFEVDKNSNKIEIKNAVEKLYNVKVLKVNTVNYDGKKKRVGKYEGKTNAYKKAFVKLQKGQTIEIFDI